MIYWRNGKVSFDRGKEETSSLATILLPSYNVVHFDKILLYYDFEWKGITMEQCLTEMGKITVRK